MLRLFIALFLLCFTVVGHTGYVQGRDLISLHYDHAPDKDDGHATVAALAVVGTLGIQPHVVSGAYGQGNGSQYQSGAEAVMSETWGTNWENAHANWQAAVNATYTKWMATLSNGGDIWIAEGGQADFTADVIRLIQSANPSINTSARIHVIQHSVWNENQANPADLNYTKSNSDYVKIEDGNGANATADLNQQSASFVTIAKNSQYGAAWNKAFNYLNPNTKLDFSDTVELLFILGVGTDRVATVNDFAAVYLSQTVSETEILQPSTPTAWSDSYSVNGQCHCDTTFDHGLESATVNTPVGNKTVSAICADIAVKFGLGSFDNRVYYNTVQCGHEPTNNAADEADCPGIPTSASNYTGYRCQQTGATWNLETLYPTTPAVIEEPASPVTPPTTEAPIEFPTCSSKVTDDNGDGYAWENNQSCVIIDPVPTPVVPTPVVDTTNETPAELTLEDLFSACSSNAIDTDGDGFSWENQQTCLVTNATPNPTETPVDQPTIETSVEPTLADLFPVCSSDAIDYDGNGFSWENQQSCLVTNATPNPTETPVDQPTIETSVEPTLADLFPVCSSDAIDYDGNGFSWENQQTCLVNSAVSDPTETPVEQPANVSPTEPNLVPSYPACSSAVTDFDGDNYAWENNQTCLVTSTQEPVTSQESIVQVTVLQFPTCSDPVADLDGDGYAWEDDQTCATSADTLPTSLVVFPLCGPLVLDENNDGYAWENNQSCRIGGN